MQLLGLALYPAHARGGRLQLTGQNRRTRRQRRLPGLQRLLLRGRVGRLTFQCVSLGLESAELVRPGRCRRLQGLRGTDRVPQRRRERALDRPQGVSGPPLQGTQVKPFNEGEYLPPFLRHQIVAPGQVPGQVDIAGCRVETQVRQGTGVGVQRVAPTSWLNC